MAAGQTQHNTAFLTVEEAATQLGVSRLRVREAVARGLLASRRDNQGHLRVDLPDTLRLTGDRNAKLEPDAIMAFLFDDIEELEASVDQRDGLITQLTDLLARQGSALDRANSALDASEAREARLSALLDRALSHLEGQDATQARLMAVSDQALSRLDQMADRLDLSLAQTQKLDGLLNRAMVMAEQGAQAGQAADRALGLLDQALVQAEGAQSAARASEGMLDRALTAGEALRAEVAAQKARMEAQDKSIETALALSERAAALAENDRPKKRGFWQRLLRR